MVDFILSIYDKLRAHRIVGLLSWLGLSACLLLSVSRLSYKEDIADFLPIDGRGHEAMKIYQDLSGANKLFAIFQYRDTAQTDPGGLVGCVDAFAEAVAQADTAHQVTRLMAQVDWEGTAELAGFVYDNIPYFLTDADYRRMDSLLSQPGYVGAQLQRDKQLLMFPVAGILSDNIQRDPVNLFTPVVEQLQRTGSGMKYELYDGHIFSPDLRKAFVVIDSPYGASETEHNAQLMALLRACADQVCAQQKGVDIHLVGGPAIAVTNASQIKADSVLSVGIAVTLILALLLFSFRNLRNLLLITLSIVWGWLFALGGLAWVHDRVSVIVVGISSVILGIAVNYPLHFIAHLSHTPDKRKALREIIMPLLVGNVTTVGAFLALVPLRSVALCDLGLFSSFLLVGTIVFVLLYLPHLAKETKETRHTFLDKLSAVSLENSKVLVLSVLVLTLVLGYFSLQTQFDANMSHINYMTDEQKADMAYLQRTMSPSGDTQKVYSISSDSTIDGALDKSLRLQLRFDQWVRQGDVADYQSCSRMVVSKAEQQCRLRRWHEFVTRHGEQLKAELREQQRTAGFADGSFDDFHALLAKPFRPQDFAFFSPLTQSLFASHFSVDSVGGRYHVVDVLSVKDKDVERVEAALDKMGGYGFDVASMNSAIANHLSDDFNYIGFACGCIVFFFLWLSFGSIELAILSFVPMAVSWVWILGIMALFGLQFNIVNVILATFIFGQGDDYTIFMTEGAMYEYAYRRKMLASYKHSIILSALIMFIGIGTLIVARHPALHSLAEVTIVGMFSVVLMAYIFPPLIFRLLVRTCGGYRRRPLTLGRVLTMAGWAVVFALQALSVFVVGLIGLKLLPFSERRWLLFRRYQQRLLVFDLLHLPRVKFQPIGVAADTFDSPAVCIVHGHSLVELMVVMALSPKSIVVTNRAMGKSFFFRKIAQWSRLQVGWEEGSLDLAQMKAYQKMGYSVMVLVDDVAAPSHELGESDTVAGRLMEEALRLADALRLDIQPVVLHGGCQVCPEKSIQLFPGTITVKALGRIGHGNADLKLPYAECVRKLRELFRTEYAQLSQKVETAAYFHDVVLDRYRYKGTEPYRTVVKRLRRFADYAEWVDKRNFPPEVVVLNSGYGEFALLYALVHRDAHITVYEPNEEKNALLRYCAEGLVGNITLVNTIPCKVESALFFAFEDTERSALAALGQWDTVVIK